MAALVLVAGCGQAAVLADGGAPDAVPDGSLCPDGEDDDCDGQDDDCDGQVDELSVCCTESTSIQFGVHSALEYRGPAAIESHIPFVDGSLEPQVSRNGVNWSMIERTQGTFDWSRMDAIVDGLGAAGITPLFVFAGSPTWANASADPFEVPANDAAFTTWVSDYADFVRTCVRRYKSSVEHWELWNEPNLSDFWRPTPDIGRYATWASAMAAAIQAEDPDAQIAYGAVTVLDVVYGPGQISGKEFIQGLYDRGIVPEIVSLHPYAFGNEPAEEHAPGDNRNTFRDVELIREIMLANGPVTAEVWLTEFGWRVGSPFGSGTVTDALQNQRIIEAFDVARRWPYVTVAVWFWDWDRPGGAAYDGWGLIDSTATPRSAAVSFRNHVDAECP